MDGTPATAPATEYPDGAPQPAPPPTVIAAVAFGCVPAPFLGVYAVLFVLRGLFIRTETPDFTDSHALEAWAGVGIGAFLVVLVLGLSGYLARRRSWLYLLTQLGVLAVAVRLLVDRSSGDPQLPAVLALGVVVSLGLAVAPASLRWAGGGLRPPGRRDAQAAAGRGRLAPADRTR